MCYFAEKGKDFVRILNGCFFLVSLKYKLMGFASPVEMVVFTQKNKCCHFMLHNSRMFQL